MTMMVDMGRKAKLAARQIAKSPTDQKNKTLQALADLLLDSAPEILDANKKDASHGKENGLSDALIDRLSLNSTRLAGIASDIRSLVDLPDPVGEIFEETTFSNGLRVHKQRVPLGVLGVIYEARPNVTMDIAGLARLGSPQRQRFPS